MTDLLRIKKKRSNYKSCFYRNCRSTTITKPEIIFVPVPKGEVRKDWIKIVRGDEDREFSLQSPLYCCADHFNLKEDLENYTRILLDPTANVRLKRGVKPRAFVFDTALAENIYDETGTEMFDEKEDSPEPKFSQEFTQVECASLESQIHQSIKVEMPISIKEEFIPYQDVSVQTDVQRRPESRSKYIQCKPKMVDASCSPILFSTFDKHNWTTDQ